MDIQIVGKHIKRCCQPLVIREIKTSDKDANFKMLEDYGTSIENSPTLVVEFKLVNLENTLVLFTNFEHTHPYDPTITPLVCTQQKCEQGTRTRLLMQHLTAPTGNNAKAHYRQNKPFVVRSCNHCSEAMKTNRKYREELHNDSEQKADAKEYVLRFMYVRQAARKTDTETE